MTRSHSQQLQVQVEELQEEVSLQEARSQGDASLLSELESSLETAGLGVDKDQVGSELRKHGLLLFLLHTISTQYKILVKLKVNILMYTEL